MLVLLDGVYRTRSAFGKASASQHECHSHRSGPLTAFNISVTSDLEINPTLGYNFSWPLSNKQFGDQPLSGFWPSWQSMLFQEKESPKATMRTLLYLVLLPQIQRACAKATSSAAHVSPECKGLPDYLGDQTIEATTHTAIVRSLGSTPINR